MEATHTHFLRLLGAYLREESPDIGDDADWKALLSLSQIHCVSGIIGYMARKYSLCRDEACSAAFRNYYLSTIVMFSRRYELAQALIQELEQAGIDHILMKGFVLRDYYQVPELRTFSDIDIVIRPSDREKAHALMLSLNYTVKDNWEPVYSYHRKEEYYEFHTGIIDGDVTEEADYVGYFADPWPNASPISAHSYRFTPEYHFLYMLTHTAKHIHHSGAGIRLYLDIAAFVLRHGDHLDWHWVEGQLRELKLFDFANVVLCAVEQWFGIARPAVFPGAPETVLADFTLFTLEAGIFGRHNRDTALAKMKQQSQDTSVSRAKLLLRQAFPKARTIQARYTYLQTKPWLLPVAWVHRFIKTGADTGKHLETARQIIQADTEEVDRLKKLTKDIGL